MRCARSVRPTSSSRRLGTHGRRTLAPRKPGRRQHRGPERSRLVTLAGHPDVVDDRHVTEQSDVLERPRDARLGHLGRPQVGDLTARERMLPVVGRTIPESRLNSVVLPAPLGPMTPWMRALAAGRASSPRGPPGPRIACSGPGRAGAADLSEVPAGTASSAHPRSRQRRSPPSPPTSTASDGGATGRATLPSGDYRTASERAVNATPAHASGGLAVQRRDALQDAARRPTGTRRGGSPRSGHRAPPASCWPVTDRARHRPPHRWVPGSRTGRRPARAGPAGRRPAR